MTISLFMIWLLIGCTLVTWIPRILPFMFVRSIRLPNVVVRWLSFIPVCILTALIVEGFIIQTDHTITLDWQVLVVLFPTLFIAFKTKSLSLTVIAGIVCMALIRFFT